MKNIVEHSHEKEYYDAQTENTALKHAEEETQATNRKLFFRGADKQMPLFLVDRQIKLMPIFSVSPSLA